MKSSIRKGKLPRPFSLSTAKARHQQLIHEIGKIRKQLDDPDRLQKLGADNYERWARRTKAAAAYMGKEADQLARWIDQQPKANLLRDAYEILRRLRTEVDLDPDEAAVIARLDVFFGE